MMIFDCFKVDFLIGLGTSRFRKRPVHTVLTQATVKL
jgi:hypothetical protein